MSIIKCPECSSQVSSFAISCPHCGFPLKNVNNLNSLSIDFVIEKKQEGIILKKYRGIQSIIEIVDEVIEISKECFIGNEYVREIRIKNLSLKVIGESAFENCKNLISVEVPDTIEYVGDYAFFKCENLSSFKLYSHYNVYPENFDPYEIEEEKWPSLGTMSFSDCAKLKSIDIPSRILRISSRCFENCYMLENVKFPNNLICIENGSFSNCSNLKKLNFPSKLETIESFAFDSCSKLENVIFPDSLHYLWLDCFCNCINVNKIVIPANVLEIHNSPGICSDTIQIVVDERNEMFCSTDGFDKECNCVIKKDGAILVCGCKNTVIPDYIRCISEHAFDCCIGLKKVKIADCVDVIGDFAFRNCGINRIEIPKLMVKIGRQAFDGCDDLKEIIFDGEIKEWKKIIRGKWSISRNEEKKIICSDGIIKEYGL